MDSTNTRRSGEGELAIHKRQMLVFCTYLHRVVKQLKEQRRFHSKEHGLWYKSPGMSRKQLNSTTSVVHLERYCSRPDQNHISPVLRLILFAY